VSNGLEGEWRETRFAMSDKGTCSGHLHHPPNQPAEAPPPKQVREETPPPEPVSLSTLGARVTRPAIDDFLDGLPDRKLAYLAVEAVRSVKRRLARGQGRGLQPKGFDRRHSPLDDALRRIGGELMEFEDPGETW
jgi:hypothetical protein